MLSETVMCLALLSPDMREADVWAIPLPDEECREALYNLPQMPWGHALIAACMERRQCETMQLYWSD
jgi:hypothetical protein